VRGNVSFAHRALTRRRALTAGGAAAVAGVAWATPAVRSLPLQGATGTPPPASTTLPPQPTIHDVAGSVTGSWSPLPGFPTATLRVTASGDLGVLGVGDLEMLVQFPGSSATGPFDGNFTITFGSGTVSGAAAGTSLTGQPPPLVALLSTTLTIEGGTGDLAGASGTLNAPLGLRTSDLGVDGSINGSIQVPG
jgi:hypothetical protein